jgi:hypothetical protein
LEDIFGRNSIIYNAFVSLTWQPSDTSISGVYDVQRALYNRKIMAYHEHLDISRGLLSSGIEQIKRKGLKNVYEGKDTSPESSEIVKILFLIDNKLRKVIRNVPDKEKEIQDGLDNIFIGANLDGQFSREKESIIYSSKSYKPDFVFDKIDTVVEIKLCKTIDKEKEIISEINDDIVAYKTKHSNLIFVIYDLGIIRDQDQFRSSLEANSQALVRVIKH